MKITYLYLLVTVTFLPLTGGNVFATTTTQPWTVAQVTTMPPRENSPSLAVPAPPDSQPGPRTASPAIRPEPRAMPAPARQAPRRSGLSDHTPQTRAIPGHRPGTVPRRGRDLSTQTRRNRGVVLCNQRQISCKNRCTARTMGTMRGMCARQCATQFQRCVDHANSLP